MSSPTVSILLLASAGFLLCLASCAGPSGTPGEPGSVGSDGDVGRDGTNGNDGNDGLDGSQGTDGLDGHAGDAPWGVHLEVLAIDGASGPGGAFEAGDPVSVDFAVSDDQGLGYRMSELYRLYFMLSGPTDHYQIVFYYKDYDVLGGAVYNGDGTYTFTFPDALPTVYHAASNDSPDLGYDDGDWSGTGLVDGTYTLAAWAYARVDQDDGNSYYDADNTTFDVLFGKATTLEPRDVAAQADCATCHGDSLDAHGGSRKEVSNCVTCHVAGAEDSSDTAVTPGYSVAFGPMIHGIHMGSSLENGLVIGEDSDFSDVVFPAWPMAAANCDACHADASGGAAAYTNPSRAACGACHDGVDFATGEGHDGGAETTDGACATCHTEDSIRGVHDDPRLDPALDSGINVSILGTSGGSGTDGQFQPGDSVTVEFSAATDDGTPFALSSCSTTEAQVTGPTTHMQMVLEASSGNVASASVYDDTSGAWSYTFANALPSTFGPQKNDTSDLGEADGDWYGLPLVSGTYYLAVNCVRTITDTNGTSWKDGSAATTQILVGDASEIETSSGVSEANCLDCHTNLEMHGRNRKGLDYCYMCHTAGSEDRYSSTDPTTTPGVTVELQPMIHKIHAGSYLSESYDINGYGSPYSTNNYNDVVFPRTDGGPAACLACHEGSDAWLDPSAHVCLSCHDSTDAAAHAALETDDTYGESCDVCHAQGRDYAVDLVHDVTP
jgi:OmcA/MtrC family decaheme c-type cytochrome